MPANMKDSKQLAVLKRLTEMLEEITLPGSDTETFKGRVYRGRTVLGAESPAPMYSLLEAPRPDLAPVDAGQEKIVQNTQWTLLLQGFALNDRLNPLDAAYGMKALAEERLARIIQRDQRGNPAYPDDFLIPVNQRKTITGLSIGPGVVRPPDQEVSANAYFYLPLVVSIALSAAEPFAV